MPERARSAKPLLIVGLLVVTVATLGGNYFLDLRRHDGRTAAARTDNDLRSAELGLSDLRGAEASYLALAANQDGATSWMNSATALQVQLESAIANLNAMTTSAAAKTHYEAAAALAQQIGAADQTARQALSGGDAAKAADIVFNQNHETAKKIGDELQAARDAELADFEANAVKIGWTAFGMNAAALVVALLMLLAAGRTGAEDTSSTSLGLTPEAPFEPVAKDSSFDLALPPTSLDLPAAKAGPDLSKAADLCIALGRVTSGAELPGLLGQAATLLGAKGIVLWVVDPAGTTLRPTVAHGYSERVIQRMGALPTDGDNVTSLAFRTRQAQILGDDDHGALAVPLITAGGAVGVLAAELSGAKAGEPKFDVARIVAAQLATLITPS